MKLLLFAAALLAAVALGYWLARPAPRPIVHLAPRITLALPATPAPTRRCIDGTPYRGAEPLPGSCSAGGW